MNYTAGGIRLSNGTWTDALGLLYDGNVDMLTVGTPVTLDGYNDFLYTTPFIVQKYSALMKRQTGALSIHVNGLTGGIDVSIYGILFAILLFLFCVSWINERCQRVSNEHNSTWHLLQSFFPLNGEMWPQQTGWTRKVLITTSGFAILILSSLYQAKLSEQLMIPYPPPVITIAHIERAVSSGNARMFFTYENGPVMTYVASVSPILNSSMRVHPPMYYTELHDILHQIDTHNAILFETDGLGLHALSELEPTLCVNYVYVTFDEWMRTFSGIIMRKQRDDLLESMNVIVAERMSFVDRHIQSTQLDDECSKHIFPVYTPDPKFHTLVLADFSGAFTFLFTLLTMSGCMLLCEVWVWRYHVRALRPPRKIIEPFETVLKVHVDATMSTELREQIFMTYVQLVELMNSA
jgi:hypothetical protein